MPYQRETKKCDGKRMDVRRIIRKQNEKGTLDFINKSKLFDWNGISQISECGHDTK
jgi:hypothetical protein